MEILIVAVGRFGGARGKGGAERALFDDYARRGAIPIDLREIVVRRTLPLVQRRRHEGELLLAAIPRDAVVVALDPKGRTWSSEDLARRLGAWRDEGTACLAFVIGGADGLDEAVIKAARHVLSLGPMTWPHLLVRAMLAEQLYRAQAILAGHPYHRE